VGPRKRAVLARLAELWRLRFGFRDDRYRFDVITVEPGDGPSSLPHITHIENAWFGVEK
jgi:Holliday junction resolvase-like predicted endonuclease